MREPLHAGKLCESVTLVGWACKKFGVGLKIQHFHTGIVIECIHREHRSQTNWIWVSLSLRSETLTPMDF
jgi:hypothetical protein